MQQSKKWKNLVAQNRRKKLKAIQERVKKKVKDREKKINHGRLSKKNLLWFNPVHIRNFEFETLVIIPYYFRPKIYSLERTYF